MDILGGLKRLLAPANPGRSEKGMVYSYVIFPGSGSYYEIPANRAEHRYKDPYRLWVYAAVDLIATKAGDFEVTLREGNAYVEDVDTHPVMQFLRTPNPYNFSQFIYIAIAQLELYGQSLWRLITRDRQKLLVNMPPEAVSVEVDDEKQVITRYEYTLASGVTMYVPASEVIRIYRPDPRQPLKPYATVSAILDTNDVDALSRDFIRGALKNGAYLPLIITADTSLDAVFASPEIQKDVLEQLKRLYRGPDGAGKPIILPGGAKILEAKTLDLKAFSELLPDARNEILGVFRLPASKLGLVEDVNRANAEANDITFMKECVLPRLNLIEDALNSYLCPMLGHPGLAVEFSLPAWEDEEHKLNEVRTLLEAGVITPNEVRVEQGKEPVPWGDVPINYGRVMAGMGFPPPMKTGGPGVVKAYSHSEMLVSNRLLFNEIVARHHAKWQAHWEAIFANANRRAKEFTEKYGLPSPEIRGQFLDYIMPEWREIKARTETVSYRLLVMGYEAARELTRRCLRRMGVENEIGIQAMIMAMAKDYVEYPWATEFARRTGEHIWQGIEDDLNEILVNAQTAEDLIGGISDLRLARINRTSLFTARTEATTSINMGELDVFKEEGVATKEWRTVGDAQTRDTHLGAEAQGEIPLDEYFDVGGFPAQYPGDPNLPHEEVINCRCALLPGKITTWEV